MKDLFDLTDKHALITGSAQGIGNLLANGPAAHGAEIMTSDITQQRAQTAVDELVAEGYRAIGYGFDAISEEEVTRTIAQIEREVRATDILINNAGIQRHHPFIEFPEAEWGKMIDVNQKSVFLVSQQVSRHMMQRRRGRVINICSMQSGLGRKTITPYATPKGAVKVLTRGMCMELVEYSVQVSGIAPGYLATDMATVLASDEAFSVQLLQYIPVVHWGSPEKLVGVAVYLATPASNFASGYLLFAGGGMLAAV